jgi:uncharacterized protein YgiM (DUF1202 family)
MIARRALLALAALATLATAGAATAPAQAGDFCTGTVRGLSRVYDPSTGSGFLAVRAGPTQSATQIGELFNGNRVEITDRRGNWYLISARGIGQGWASVRWLRNNCGW